MAQHFATNLIEFHVSDDKKFLFREALLQVIDTYESGTPKTLKLILSPNDIEYTGTSPIFVQSLVAESAMKDL